MNKKPINYCIKKLISKYIGYLPYKMCQKRLIKSYQLTIMYFRYNKVKHGTKEFNFKNNHLKKVLYEKTGLFIKPLQYIRWSNFISYLRIRISYFMNYQTYNFLPTHKTTHFLYILYSTYKYKIYKYI